MSASLRIPKGGVRLILTLAEDGHFEVEHASSDDYGLQAFMLHRALDALHFNARVVVQEPPLTLEDELAWLNGAEYRKEFQAAMDKRKAD